MSKKLGNAKVTEAEAIGLYARIAGGASVVADEAERFGVSVETVRRIMRGDTFGQATNARALNRERQAAKLPTHREDGTRVVPLADEPTRQEAEASLARLTAMLADDPKAKGERLVDEMIAGARAAGEGPREVPRDPLDE